MLSERSVYQLLSERLPAVLWTTDEKLCITSLAGQGLSLLGLEASAFLGQELGRLLCDMTPSRVALSAARSAMEGAPVRFEGEWRGWRQLTSVDPLLPSNGIEGVIGLAQLLEEKKGPEPQRPSAGAHTTLLNHVSGMAYRCRNDEDWTMELVSEGCFRLTGYTAYELMENRTLAFADLIHPDDVDELWEKCQTALAAQVPCSNEYRIRTRDGEEKWVWDQAHGLYSPSGELLFVEGLVTDITKRKQANQALRASEERLELVLTGADLCVWDWNTETGGIVFNERWSELLETDPGPLETTYEAWRERVHPEDRERVSKVLEDHLAGRSASYEMEYRIATQSDHWKWMRARGRIVHRKPCGAPLRVTGIHHDVTEQRELEEQLQQAQKMESIGQLAGGVAHDFNNLLLVILSHSELALARTKAHEEHLTQIRDAAERAAALTRQLLVFSRRQSMQLEALDFSELIHRLLRMIRRLIPENIEIIERLTSREATIHGDRGQLEQVITNLCVNARDAMPQGGTLTIATDVMIVNDGSVAQAPGRYVVLTVRDTGVGMSAEVCRRAFEPFFTTKGAGMGTGLGLAMVYGILEKHGGRIDISSDTGRGTTIRVQLPCTEEITKRSRSTSNEIIITRDEKTILVAEDEAPVLELVSRILELGGYRVLQAKDGEEALRVFDDFADEIALVLLDVVMPRLSGRQVFEQLRARNPELRCLLTSGYSTRDLSADFLAEAGLEILQKPYRPKELLRAVRKHLS